MPHVLRAHVLLASVLLAALGCEGQPPPTASCARHSPVSAACVLSAKDEGKAKIKDRVQMPAAGAAMVEFTRTSGQQLSVHVKVAGSAPDHVR